MNVYGQGLLFLSNDKIEIDTALSERETTQAKLLQNLTEPGVLITPKTDGTFSFTPYTFSSTEKKIALGRKTESIFVQGPGFDGVPLSELLHVDMIESSSKPGTLFPQETSLNSDTINKLNLLSLAVEYAYKNYVLLPNIGPLGTLFGKDNTILILPQTIFLRALNSLGASLFSKCFGWWEKLGLKSLDSWRFTLSSYVYTTLTGIIPFPDTDENERTLKQINNNFIKINWLCKLKPINLSEDITVFEQNTTKLFNSININLSCPLPEQSNKKQHKKSNFITLEIPQIPQNTNTEYLSLEKNNEYLLFKKNIKRKTYIRNHSLELKIVLGVFIAVLILGITIIKEQTAKPTTKGMLPIEVVKMFYTAFNEMDSSRLEASKIGSAGNKYTNMVNNVFVTSKVRQTYEKEQEVYTPGQWLNMLNPASKGVFGITNLEISPIYISTTESQKNIAICNAEYYVIFSQNKEFYLIQKMKDTITLSYKNNRWRISDMKIEFEEIPVNSEEFIQSLKLVSPETFTEEQGKNIIKELKDEYPWLPSSEEVALGLEQLQQMYSNSF